MHSSELTFIHKYSYCMRNYGNALAMFNMTSSYVVLQVMDTLTLKPLALRHARQCALRTRLSNIEIEGD